MSIKQFFLILTFFSIPLSAHFFTVVLDPGVQHDTTITQETLTCVKALQQSLEDTFPQARIVLSSSSQEAVNPLQVASFSNRIKANLHISFNFFSEKEVTKNIRAYFCLTPVGIKKKSSELSLIPAEKAYEQHAQESKTFAHIFFNAAKNTGPLTVFEPKELPLKTLQTVSAPSFLLEIGIGKPKEWKVYFPQLFEGLKEVIASAIGKNE